MRFCRIEIFLILLFFTSVLGYLHLDIPFYIFAIFFSIYTGVSVVKAIID